MSLWMTDLDVAVASSGLAVVEVPGWRTRGHGPMNGSPQALVCHHTAGPATGEFPSQNVVVNGRPDLTGPLCNLGLGRSGTVYVVAAGLAYHAGTTFQTWQSNGWSIGIEAEATGVDTWPTWQWNAYAHLCRALCNHYGIPIGHVLGHKEVASPLGRKVDPNFDMSTFRSAVAAWPPPAPHLLETDSMYVKCESTPGGPILTGVLSGSLLMGLGTPGEVASADANIANGALVQWVERVTWDALDAASHRVHDNPRPVSVVACPKEN